MKQHIQSNSVDVCQTVSLDLYITQGNKEFAFDADFSDSSDSSSSSSVDAASVACHIVSSDPLPCTRQRKQRRRRQVQFASVVQVQEYALVLGDHPCAGYFPLSLDWAHAASKQVSAVEYEATAASSSQVQPLTSMERCARLSTIMGISNSEMTQLEARRLGFGHATSYNCGGEWEDDNEECEFWE